MKTISFLVLSAVLFVVSSAIATPRIAQMPEGICTRDINLWGHASQCSCQDDAVYDQRSGLCLRGDGPEVINVQGSIHSGMMAIGGETTGFMITVPHGQSFELFLKKSDRERLSTSQGTQFAVEGEFVTIEGVERKERTAIIVDRLTVVEE